jgi:hypothetical protein
MGEIRKARGGDSRENYGLARTGYSTNCNGRTE